MTMLQADTDTIIEVAQLDPSDPIKTHIVSCPMDKSSTEAWIVEARIFGLEVEAICGYKWVPQDDPDKHPICEPCLAEAKARSGN